MSAIDELEQILGEMADLEEGEDGDSILFTHDLCVNAVKELATLRSDLASKEAENKALREALEKIADIDDWETLAEARGIAYYALHPKAHKETT